VTTTLDFTMVKVNQRQSYTDKDFRDAVGEDGATTKQVVDEVGCVKRTALRRLRELEEKGEVRCDRTFLNQGANLRYWELSE
jgi:hypothetical protein